MSPPPHVKITGPHKEVSQAIHTDSSESSALSPVIFSTFCPMCELAPSQGGHSTVIATSLTRCREIGHPIPLWSVSLIWEEPPTLGFAVNGKFWSLRGCSHITVKRVRPCRTYGWPMRGHRGWEKLVTASPRPHQQSVSLSHLGACNACNAPDRIIQQNKSHYKSSQWWHFNSEAILVETI